MPDLKLTLACWDYDRARPLIDGRVKPEGIDLDIEVLRPRQAFQRMLDNKEFDVSELSLASYTALKGRGTISLRPAWNDYALSGLLRKHEPRRP
jgi:4,5-dihydroxyphthalate decarboxylase